MARDKEPIAYEIRHGQSGDNQKKVFRSWTALPLTEEGRKQAEDAASRLGGLGITSILASPLPRAFETAEIFAVKAKLPIFEDHRLMGWKTGAFEGLLESEVDDAMKLFVENPDVAPPLGVSLNDFENTVADFLDEMLPMAEKEGPFAFFTHNSVITATLNLLEGKRVRHPRSAEAVGTGGILAIYANGDHYDAEPLSPVEKESEIAA